MPNLKSYWYNTEEFNDGGVLEQNTTKHMMGQKHNDNFFVVTGGPGVGKTTLLVELQKRGYEIVPEIARTLIKEQCDNNGEALPWKNKELFKRLMFHRSIESFEQMDKKQHKNTPLLFDRGFLDALCYAALIQSNIDEAMEAYAQYWRYNNTVFILPPWLEIYTKDSERKQEWNEAVLTYQQMKSTYQQYGYTIVEVPPETVEKRADYVVRVVQHSMARNNKNDGQ